MERRTTRLGSNKKRLSDAPSRRLLRPWGLTSGTGASLRLAIQAGFRPPFTCPVQPFKAEPHSGLGRLPKAPRVRACEAWPRAPHPTGLGYPAPAKLSLKDRFSAEWEPERMPYGMLEFAIKDLNRYLLSFGQRVGSCDRRSFSPSQVISQDLCAGYNPTAGPALPMISGRSLERRLTWARFARH
jgi:hypothetical protein